MEVVNIHITIPPSYIFLNNKIENIIILLLLLSYKMGISDLCIGAPSGYYSTSDYREACGNSWSNQESQEELEKKYNKLKETTCPNIEYERSGDNHLMIRGLCECGKYTDSIRNDNFYGSSVLCCKQCDPSTETTKYKYNSSNLCWKVDSINTNCIICNNSQWVSKSHHINNFRCKQCDPSTETDIYDYDYNSYQWVFRHYINKCNLCDNKLIQYDNSNKTCYNYIYGDLYYGKNIIQQCYACKPTQLYIKFKFFEQAGWIVAKKKCLSNNTIVPRHVWVNAGLSTPINYKCECVKCNETPVEKKRLKKEAEEKLRLKKLRIKKRAEARSKITNNITNELENIHIDKREELKIYINASNQDIKIITTNETNDDANYELYDFNEISKYMPDEFNETPFYGSCVVCYATTEKFINTKPIICNNCRHKKTYLRVAYKNKDEAKQMGAMFDGDKRRWYVHNSNYENRQLLIETWGIWK